MAETIGSVVGDVPAETPRAQFHKLIPRGRMKTLTTREREVVALADSFCGVGGLPRMTITTTCGATLAAGLPLRARDKGLPLTPWLGLGVVAVWSAGALLLGALVLKSRDA